MTGTVAGRTRDCTKARDAAKAANTEIPTMMVRMVEAVTDISLFE
jgi:hypothetical protein